MLVGQMRNNVAVKSTAVWAVCSMAVATAVGLGVAVNTPVVLLLVAAAVFVALAYGRRTGLPLLFGVMTLIPITVWFGGGVLMSTVVIAAMIAASIIGTVRRVSTGGPLSSRAGNAVLVVYGLVLLSTAVNAVEWGAVLVWQRPYFAAVLVAWHVAAEAKVNPEGMQRAVRFLLWVSVPIAALAVYQRATGTWPVLDDYAIGRQYAWFRFRPVGRCNGSPDHLRRLLHGDDHRRDGDAPPPRSRLPSRQHQRGRAPLDRRTFRLARCCRRHRRCSPSPRADGRSVVWLRWQRPAPSASR